MFLKGTFAIFGNFTHKMMYLFYETIVRLKQSELGKDVITSFLSVASLMTSQFFRFAGIIRFLYY